MIANEFTCEHTPQCSNDLSWILRWRRNDGVDAN